MSDTRPHTDPPAGATLTGTVLGSYRLLGELASGNMGTVFRAEHLLLGRSAAVKVLRRELTANHELVQRLINEARAVTASKHPGIVEVYDFGHTPDGHGFIVMELLEGEPLSRRLARGRISEGEAVTVAIGIASALKAAHKVGVIHRDLKPDNVFLVPDPDGGSDRTKVLDFGIAKLADPMVTGQTQTGALIGTPMYMAPEQARAAQAIDHRADLYSLGCMLYHMLVGRPPFVAEGGGEIIALQMFGEVEPPSRHAAITPEMDALVLRLLEKEPAQRPGSAAEVLAALTAIDAALTSQGGAWLAAPAARVVPPMRAVAPSAELAPAVPPRPLQTRPLQLGDDAPPGLPPAKRSTMPMIAALVTGLAIAAVAVTFAVMRSSGDAPSPGAPPSSAGPTAPGAATTTPGAATTTPGTAMTTRGTATSTPATGTTGAVHAQPATTHAPAPHATVPHAIATPAAPHHAAAATTHPAAKAAAASHTAAAASHTAAAAGHTAAAAKHGAPPPAHGAPAAPAGPVTRPGDNGAPDRAIEVIRDIRQVDPPVSGPHTRDGSPMETSVDLHAKSPTAAPVRSPKDAPNP